MRIALLLNRDVFANYCLNLLWPTLAPHVTAMFYSRGVGNPRKQAHLSTLKFYEHTLFEQWLTPQADRRSEGFKSFEALAEHANISAQYLENPNSPEGLSRLHDVKADWFLSIRFGKILKTPAIALARRGVLNLHSGLLPNYRGVMATLHALAAGDSTIGSTLHFISDAGIDTGDIISTARLPVRPGVSYFQHLVWLYENAVPQVIEALVVIAHGGKLKASKPTHSGQYFSAPESHTLEELTKAGHALVNTEDFIRLARHYTEF